MRRQKVNQNSRVETRGSGNPLAAAFTGWIRWGRWNEKRKPNIFSADDGIIAKVFINALAGSNAICLSSSTQ
jgi:hypothetical protein